MLTATQVERGAYAVTARALEKKNLGVIRVIPGGIGQYVSPLLFGETPSSFGVDRMDRRLARLIQLAETRPDIVYDSRFPYTNTEVGRSLQLHGVALPQNISGNLRSVIIGSGPAAVITGRVLNELGFKHVKYLTPDARIGGIWAPHEGIWGEDKYFGYNNPGPVTVFDSSLIIWPSRSTRKVQGFLCRAAEEDIFAKKVNGTATGIDFDGSKHIVFYQDPLGRDREMPPADLVIAATGNKPLPLKDGYIDFALPDTVKIPVKRWPNLLKKEEAEALHNNHQKIVCIGWGNSTMAKIREAEWWRDNYGYTIDIVVLTHQSRDALDYPERPTLQPDGKRRALARDPRHGQFTKLELDLRESRQLYTRHKDEELVNDTHVVRGTVASVVGCSFFEDNGVINARIFTNDLLGERIITNVGEIDAFIGYGNDSELMRAFGLRVTDDYRGTVDLRQFDGRGISTDGRKVHLTGAAAATREDTTARVLNGIVRSAGEIGLTAIYEAAAATEALSA